MVRSLVMGAALLVLGLSSTAALAAPVALNDASKKELTQVKGIGDVLAERIVAYRKANDGFDEVAELTEVKGIGKATLADLKGQVALNQ